MEKNKRRSIAIFWDYENARPVAETSIVGLSGRIRDLLIPHGDIVSRKVYYDSQSPSELKTNRTDLDMTGWTLVDCPKRQKKETLDKKIIVDFRTLAVSFSKSSYLINNLGEGYLAQYKK